MGDRRSEYETLKQSAFLVVVWWENAAVNCGEDVVDIEWQVFWV